MKLYQLFTFVISYFFFPLLIDQTSLFRIAFVTIIILHVLIVIPTQLFVLDQDLSPQELRRRQSPERLVNLVCIQQVTQDVLQMLGDLVLLLDAAVVFEGEEERIVGGVEGVGKDGVGDDFSDENLSGHCPAFFEAVVNHRFAVFAVPTIH